jgi:oligoendopeptidase F
MSKQAKKGKVFSYTPTYDLPKLSKNIPIEWDMKGLYYKSISDPQIEKDVVTTERAYTAFVKKFKGSDFKSNPKTLQAALDTLNAIEENPVSAKPGRYLGLLTTLNADDEAANKKLALIGQRMTRAGNETLFFGLELAKASKAEQKVLLAAPELEGFVYYLKCVFANAKHHLSEAEEKIVSLLGECSYGMWVDMTEKMLGRKVVIYKGKEIPLNEALNLLSSLPFKEQPVLWKLIMTETATLSEVAESELTAICSRAKISDELRQYTKPYSASVISKEDDEKSVEALIQAVSTTGFKLSKKFYKHKAKLNGVKQMEYAQRNAALGNAPTIGFAQSTDICRDVFYGVNPKYGQLFDKILVNGQIDAHPKKGKRGGAFMSSEVSQPSHVFLNHVDTIDSLETYAHEMGHAIHSERAKTQPAHYEGYSLTTAETASTLFESLLFDAIVAQASDTEKVTLLHNKLGRDISTIQRQIAFHNFELEMHNTVRNQGAITRHELNLIMQNHLKSYCGPAVNVNELDGHSYIYVGHFRYNFYVYTYVFGTLMSTIMAEKFTADNLYATQIDKFLTAGGSANVADIFKSIGLNTKKIETFEYGLKKMENEITLLQKLTK